MSNKLGLYVEELLAGRPPLVVCPRLLIQYIHICRPYPPSATWGRAMPSWQGHTYHGQKWCDVFKLTHRQTL